MKELITVFQAVQAKVSQGQFIVQRVFLFAFYFYHFCGVVIHF